MTAESSVVSRVRGIEASVLREIVKSSSLPGILSLAGGMPADDLFDLAGLRAAAEGVLERDPVAALQYGPSEGSEPLRSEISALMTGRRVADLDLGEILVTTGSSQGIDLVGRMLLEPGDVLAVERPTFLATLKMAELCGAHVVEAPTDERGLAVERFEALLERAPVKVLYTMPTFSNPTGTLLPLERRRRLLELAGQAGVVVVEDDPYGCLWAERPPPPCLLSLARELDDPPTCVYLSSFSKIVAPGLRTGWLVAPRPLVERAAVVKQVADAQTSSLDQAIVLAYLESDRLGACEERARRAYAERSRWLAEAIRTGLPAGVMDFSPPAGGMFLWCRLRDRLALQVAERALAHGVAVVPGDPFFSSPPGAQYLRLSYSMLRESSAGEAIRRLARALGA